MGAESKLHVDSSRPPAPSPSSSRGDTIETTKYEFRPRTYDVATNPTRRERDRVTIPKWLREEFGIEGGDEVRIESEGEEITIRTTSPAADDAEDPLGPHNGSAETPSRTDTETTGARTTPTGTTVPSPTSGKTPDSVRSGSDRPHRGSVPRWIGARTRRFERRAVLSGQTVHRRRYNPDGTRGSDRGLRGRSHGREPQLLPDLREPVVAPRVRTRGRRPTGRPRRRRYRPGRRARRPSVR